ncbi:hypothetical protein BH11PLA2_BH11PLA2_15760 [soil metagenome]
MNPADTKLLAERFVVHFPLRMSGNELFPGVFLPEQKPATMHAGRVQKAKKLPIPFLA